MVMYHIFVRSDAAATIWLQISVQLLLEGSYNLRAAFISLEILPISTMAG